MNTLRLSRAHHHTSHRTSHRTHVRAASVSALALGLAAALTACSGGGDEGVHADNSPAEVLEIASTFLEETEGAALTLEASGFPDNTNGIIAAEGLYSSAPAFDGTLTVRIQNTPVPVPVIALDDKVWANIPFTPGWSDIDPAEYGAPDPSQLLTPDNGVGALLDATVDPKKGGTARGGKDNDEKLTTYTGTIPGDVMERVIPSSAGDEFEVEYRITEDGHLSEVAMTGVFYENTPEMKYSLTVSDYGRKVSVKAP